MNPRILDPSPLAPPASNPSRARTFLLLAAEAALGVASSLAIVVLSYYVLRGMLRPGARFLDLTLAAAVYRWRDPALTTAMMVLTNLGSTYLMGGSLLVLAPLAWRRHRREVAQFVTVFVMGVLINLLLKVVIHRPRPTVAPLVEVSGYSFPSGHAMNSLVFYSTVAYFFRRVATRKALGLAAMLLAAATVLAVGLSRIYLGVHYPSDVVAGYLVGAWWLVLARRIARSPALERVLGARAPRPAG